MMEYSELHARQFLPREKPIFSRLISRTASSVVILLSFFSVAESATADSTTTNGFIGQVSTETMPVVITIHGIRLAIPRNYLHDLLVTDSKIAIMVVATFPGFKGASAPGEEEFHFGGYPSSPRLLMAYTAEVSEPDQAYKPWDDPAINLAQKSQAAPSEFGLVKIQGPELEWEYYVHLSPKRKDEFVIKCMPGAVAPNPVRCHDGFALPNDLVIAYEFDSSLLPKWREIRTGLIDLFASWGSK